MRNNRGITDRLPRRWAVALILVLGALAGTAWLVLPSQRALANDSTPSTPANTAHQFEIRPNYILSVTLDYTARTAVVQQHIQYTNHTGKRLSQIMLTVDPNRCWRCFSFRSTPRANGWPVARYTLDGIRLTIPLNRSLAPGQVLDLSFEYDLNLPYNMRAAGDYWPDPFGHSSRQVNLTAWYAYIPPYEPETGWVIHDPWRYGEHQVYAEADFDVQLTVKSAPAGTLIAASALPLATGQPYRYHLEAGRNFAISVSEDYEMLQADVDGVTLLGYHFKGDEEAGVAAFEAMVEAFALYNDLFADYPHDSLTLVAAGFYHSMEYPGLVFVGKDAYNQYENGFANRLIRLTAHETAHQWWYGLVASDQAAEPWLDEALATYSEMLFFEYARPELLDWWDNRLTLVAPRGSLGMELYETGDSQSYFIDIYLVGARFLHDLRSEMGDEAFLSFLHAYAEQSAHRIVSSDDFFHLLDASTDADVGTIIDRYFQSR